MFLKTLSVSFSDNKHFIVEEMVNKLVTVVGVNMQMLLVTTGLNREMWLAEIDTINT